MSLFSSDTPSSDDGHINVIAEFTAKPEHANDVKDMLTGLVGPARAEDGCEDYHLLVSRKNPANIYTYESWKSEEKLNKHLEGIKGKLGEMLPLLTGEPKITVLNHVV